jgi:hypothetical protein
MGQLNNIQLTSVDAAKITVHQKKCAKEESNYLPQASWGNYSAVKWHILFRVARTTIAYFLHLSIIFALAEVLHPASASPPIYSSMVAAGDRAFAMSKGVQWPSSPSSNSSSSREIKQQLQATCQYGASISVRKCCQSEENIHKGNEF